MKLLHFNVGKEGLKSLKTRSPKVYGNVHRYIRLQWKEDAALPFLEPRGVK